MHYFLIAGEASGDLHGADLVSAIRQIDRGAVISFFGGDKMAVAAGHEPLMHYRRMNFMGFSEVLRNIGKVAANLSAAKNAVEMASPDALILIDYPSFNLKVGAYAAKLGIPVYYYISPKIWAWKKWRIRDIRRYVRRVFSILPFEPAFYQANGGNAEYVGNPSVAEIARQLASAPSREEFLERHKLRDRPIIALMPGSRRGEIRNNLPIMREASDRFPRYRAIIIGAPGVPDAVYAASGAGTIPIVREEHTAHILCHCRGALVTSGTATLETALAGVPQVVMYRANGSKLSYGIMSRILDVEHVSLPNLIVGRTVVPELLLHLCTPGAAAGALAPLLDEQSAAFKAQMQGYADMKAALGDGDAAANTARRIVDECMAKKA